HGSRVTGNWSRGRRSNWSSRGPGRGRGRARGWDRSRSGVVASSGSASPDGRAGDNVGGGILAVEVEEDTLAVRLVTTNKVKVLVWLCGSARGDLDLHASWVELSSAGRVDLEVGV